MTPPDIKDRAKALIRVAESDSLYTALTEVADPEMIISALLYSLGFRYIHVLRTESGVTFSAGYSNESAHHHLTLNVSDHQYILEGDLVADVEKAYRIVHLFEHRLGDWSYLPAEMRFGRIRAFCEAADIDIEFYDHVLRNWVR